MSIGLAGLMCHAPIVVPAVGGPRSGQCAQTTRAMRAVAARLAARDPDLLVLLSPHTPRVPNRWGLRGGDRVRGDFGAFGAPTAGVDLPAAVDAREQLAARQVPTVSIADRTLDHGALVPLWFLAEAGLRAEVLVIGLPWEDEAADTDAMGQAIADICAERHAVVLASGDMSHRLVVGAPAGYHPRASAFDREVVVHLSNGEPKRLRDIDPSLRAIAAEDVITTTLTASAAVGHRSDGHAVLSYEGPFGVGYCEAILFEDGLFDDGGSAS